VSKVEYIESSAVFSEETPPRYRYELRRRWAPGPVALWVGANPSKAGAAANEPDHTLDRIVWFSRHHATLPESPLEGVGGILLANTLAYISTDPAGLLLTRDPVGPRTDEFLAKLADEAVAIVVCWGQIPDRRRVSEVVSILTRSGKPLLCLGTGGKGSPLHPARLANTTSIVPWRRVA
jgi:hypothetical protein